MRYVALLRGINVGGNHKVEMKKLKKIFEDLNFKNVSTYINSGNVIFDSDTVDVDRIAAKIKSGLKENFSFEIGFVIRDLKNIQKIVSKVPENYQNNTEQKTDVIFLWDEYCNASSLKLLKINDEVDAVRYIDGAIVWHIDKKNYNKSGMHKLIETPIYKKSTIRNINTVRKLAELMV